MKLSEINEIVTHKYSKKYRVKLKSGKSEVVRLWLADCGVAIMRKRSRKHGYYLYREIENWETLKLVEHKECDKFKLVKKRAQDAVKYLAQSGFWADIKKEIEYFLSDDSIIEGFCEDMANGGYENVYCKRGEGEKYEWCHTYQVFESFYNKKCWKSIAYHSKFDRERHNSQIEKAIAEKSNYHRRWTNGYDNTIDIVFDKNGSRGWYSEEYRNCGNGHYYLLFDATHAIFYEDD